jgi:hypothetical protein
MIYCGILLNPVAFFVKFQGGAQIYNLADMLQHQMFLTEIMTVQFSDVSQHQTPAFWVCYGLFLKHVRIFYSTN